MDKPFGSLATGEPFNWPHKGVRRKFVKLAADQAVDTSDGKDKKWFFRPDCDVELWEADDGA